MGTREREWFDELWERHYAAVVAFAVRRSDRDTAADVAAEVFTVAWRRRERVPEGDQERLWLYGVARRVLANRRRGLRRAVALVRRLAVEGEGTAPGPEPGRTAILDALRTLSGRDREVLRLAAWEGLSSEEAGAVLGCRPATFDVRLHRARARLRAALDTDTATASTVGAPAEETP